MQKLGDKTVIRHTYDNTVATGLFNQVLVATDSEIIFQEIVSHGGNAVMSMREHESGSDRIAEAIAGLQVDVVVNVQGDEPLIPPAVIDQVAGNLAANPAAGIATLREEISTIEELVNPNAVKVVSNEQGMALYFSRATIPWPRDAFAERQEAMPGAGHWYRHIGIYAYRCAFLHQYVTWQPAPLEQLECLEQLRALYNAAGTLLGIGHCKQEQVIRHRPRGDPGFLAVDDVVASVF